MNKLSFYTMLAVLAIPLQANASSCPTTPTCEGLGYKYDESETGQYNFIRCPLDTSKVFYYKPEDTPCRKGMIYDSSKQKCYTGIPHGNAGSLYYIWERDGNDAIVTPLGGWQGSYITEGSASLIYYNKTLTTDNWEFLTLAQIEQLIELDFISYVPRVMYMNGLTGIYYVTYKKPGISITRYEELPTVSIFISAGSTTLEYSTLSEGWGYSNHSIYKTKIAISPSASNVTEYTIDTMIPSSYTYTGNLSTSKTCSSYRNTSSSAQNYCDNNASGIASNSEVREVFDNDPDKLKEFLTISGTTNQSHLIITREGCFYIDSGGILKNIDDNATLNGIATTASSARNLFYFCKTYKE